MPPPSPLRRAAGLGLVGAVVSLVALPTPQPEARPPRDLARVDLRVRPGDLKPPAPPRPAPPFAVAAEPEGRPGLALSDQVEATDRARRGAIPDRRREQNLLPIGAEGSLIQELLENQTIPLFRVTIEPPF